MHSKIFDDNFRIFYNGDYDGDVHVVKAHPTDPKFEQEVIIPIGHLFEFVADAIRAKMISEIESMDTKDVLTGVYPYLKAMRNERSERE